MGKSAGVRIVGHGYGIIPEFPTRGQRRRERCQIQQPQYPIWVCIVMAMALSCWRGALGYPSGVTPLNQRDSLGYPGRLNAGDMHWLAHVGTTPLNQRLIAGIPKRTQYWRSTLIYLDDLCWRLLAKNILVDKVRRIGRDWQLPTEIPKRAWFYLFESEDNGKMAAGIPAWLISAAISMGVGVFGPGPDKYPNTLWSARCASISFSPK